MASNKKIKIKDEEISVSDDYYALIDAINKLSLKISSLVSK